MSVQFIIGRSGTGKTSYCIKGIVDALVGGSDDRSLLLLVPEQATYQAERAILADKRIGGYHRLSVLSFERLQFLLGGRNTALPVLSATGRQMIIHKILREQKSRLKVLGGSAESVGLARQMVETIAEMLRYAKGPDDIEQLVEELEGNEGGRFALLKFADVGLIFGEYLKFIEGRFADADAQLLCAKKLIGDAEFAKGAKLWVDGFSGFTTAEFEVLVELLKAAGESQIALCMDASNIDLANPDGDGIERVGLFNPTEGTYAELFDVIKKSKLGLKEPVVLEQAVRFSKCPELGHIERNMFNPEAAKISAAGNVRFVSAGNARGEVRFAAKEIVRLVSEQGYRYRDIAVIASDIDSYEHYIRAYFEDYDIPFFIDKRRPLNQHPVVQLICSALQTVTGGFSFGDIFTYLKTDLVGAERRRVDELENYCIGFGIGEDEWLGEEDWHFAAKDDDNFDERQINQIRREVCGPLLKLRGKLIDENEQRRQVTGCEFTEIIFEFLERLGVREKVGAWVEGAVEAGDLQTADEHRQFFDRFVTVFDELVDVFGEEKMDCMDYLAIINCAFSQLTLAFIPPTLDQVLIGSIERSRHPGLKAVFLTGATQKQFPSPLFYNSVLSDDDRTIAEEKDFYLAPAMSVSVIERQYLGYIAFTRACERLYVTYPMADEKGNAMMRSQFVGDIEALFENFSEESDTQGQLGIENIYTESELAEVFCGCLGHDANGSDANGGESLGELLEEVCGDDELGQVGRFAKSAINYKNQAQLDSGTVKSFFGNQLKSSVSRLGTFAACPYKYFACYILGLKERKEVKFEPLDIGQFYHSVLDAWLKRVKLTKKRFREIKDGDLAGILEKEIQKLVESDSFISNFVRHSGQNKFIIHTICERLEEALAVIVEMVRAGDFEPGCSEVVFGGENEGLGEYKIRLSKKKDLFLYGKIDRLDIADSAGDKAAAVFDYKRRDKRFSWGKFYYGLDMQLLVYILAVRETCGDKYKIRNAVGGFYIPIEVPADKVTLNKVKEKRIGTAHKAKGIFNGDFFDRFDNKAGSKWSNFYNFAVTKGKGQYAYYGSSGALKPEDFENALQYTRKKIAEFAEEILCGSIDIKPYKLGPETACQYCKYRAVCRFDWLINDYNYLESLGKLSVLEKIKDGEI